MNIIDPPWIGSDGYDGKEEFTFKITMTGELSIYADSEDEAFEIANDMVKGELMDYIDDVLIE